MPAEPRSEPPPSDPSYGAAPRSPRRTAFFARLGSTLGLWAFVAGALWFGNVYLLLALLGIVAMAGLAEYDRMVRVEGDGPHRILRFLSAAGYLIAASWILAAGGGGEETFALDVAAVAATAFASFAVTMRATLRGRTSLDVILADVFGLIYIPILFMFMGRLLVLPGIAEESGKAEGVVLMLYVIAVTKFTDMGAYAIGSLIGKRKMIPHISPGKTWEGFGGALLGALAAGFTMTALFPDQLGGLTPLLGAALAILIAIVAVIGDLAESILKRCVGVKDSGATLPGIGGALDLIDSLLFTAPAAYFFFRIGGIL